MSAESESAGERHRVAQLQLSVLDALIYANGLVDLRLGSVVGLALRRTRGALPGIRRVRQRRDNCTSIG